MYYTHLDTPVGPFLVAGDEHAVRLTSFTGGSQHRRPEPDWVDDAGPLSEAVGQLEEYFAGTRRNFDLSLELNGTDFQRRVWAALRSIPFGETRSYGEVAKAIGRPGAARAIGAANVANVHPILIPCHRVLGAKGELTGFGGGLTTKRWLLSLEERERVIE